MSGLIRLGLLLLFFISCQSKENQVASPPQGEAPYFSPSEVIAAANVLTAIIDLPQDTLTHQKNLGVTPESAQKLMLPLHPLYDEKVEEVAVQLPTFSKEKLSEIYNGCSAKCECEFYLEIFDRHPEMKQKVALEFKYSSVIDKKKQTLTCLQSLPHLQNLLNHLRSEQKNYEAESAF